MRAITFIVLTLLFVTANAQKSPVEKFIANNAYEEGITMQEIDPQHTEFPMDISTDGVQVKEILAQFENIKIINCSPEKTSTATRDNFYSKAYETLQHKKYLEMVSIHVNDETFDIFTYQKKSGIINEFVLLMKDGEEIGMLYIKGEIDLSSFDAGPFIAALSKGKSCGSK